MHPRKQNAAHAANEMTMLTLQWGVRLRGNMLRLVLWVLAGVLGLSVAGCAVGPDFKAPDAPVSRYTSPGEALPAKHATDRGEPAVQTIAVGEKVSADWWKLFQSRELNRVVKDAIADSPTLESAEAKLAQAHEAVTVAASALYPQIGLNAGDQQEKASANSFGVLPNAFPLPPNFNLLQVGPSASYTPDLFGGTHRRIEQQLALADYRAEQIGAAYLALTGNTVSQAVQAAAARAQLKAVNDILAIDRQNLDHVHKERQAGTASDSDVVTAESQLATDETLLPGIEQQLSVANHALAVLTGRAPGNWSPPAFDLTGLSLPHRLPVTVPSELVHQRPDIRAAEAQLHADCAQIGIATAQLYPSITLSAAISPTSLNGSSLFDPSGLVWSVAAGLAQPVFDGGMREAERRAALDAFKASAADYKQTVLQAFEQVADILQALAHDEMLMAAQNRALATASESLRLQRINYTNGAIGIINLLDVQRQYQQAQLGYVRTKAQHYQDTVQLLVAMGGGWAGTKLATKEDGTNSVPN
jgi:NodT family efflux transporter outer membrane factor (OMF) lipoprotein